MKVSLIWFVASLSCAITQTVSAEEAVPDMALLEFLGSFETEDEQWFDPTLLIDVENFDESFEKGQKNEDD